MSHTSKLEYGFKLCDVLACHTCMSAFELAFTLISVSAHIMKQINTPPTHSGMFINSKKKKKFVTKQSFLCYYFNSSFFPALFIFLLTLCSCCYINTLSSPNSISFLCRCFNTEKKYTDLKTIAMYRKKEITHFIYAYYR